MKALDEDIEIIKTKGWVYYAKWISTVIVIVSVACRSVPEIPKIYDVFLSFIGCLGWLYVGLSWKDRALIMLNSVLVFMLGLSILKWLA